jgi:hypothetical protein
LVTEVLYEIFVCIARQDSFRASLAVLRGHRPYQ